MIAPKEVPEVQGHERMDDIIPFDNHILGDVGTAGALARVVMGQRTT
jgi:hypothetical protein